MKFIHLFLIPIFFGCSVQSQNMPKDESYYQVFGKGKPIIIINGGPGMNSQGFVSIAKEIAALNYQTIIYDQRGTGNSKLEIIDSSTITMDLMVQDLENLRKKLQISKWTVFGQSFGGILATYYESKYPESIDKIIYSASGGMNLKFLNYIPQRINNNLTKTEQDSLHFYEKANLPEQKKLQKRAQFLANAYVFNKTNAPIIAERLTQVNFKVNALVFQNLQKIAYDFTNKFINNKKPILVIQGKNDIISVETAEEIKNSFGNAQLVLIDNCGHYGWLDAKEIYLESIKNFLDNN